MLKRVLSNCIHQRLTGGANDFQSLFLIFHFCFLFFFFPRFWELAGELQNVHVTDEINSIIVTELLFLQFWGHGCGELH